MPSNEKNFKLYIFSIGEENCAFLERRKIFHDGYVKISISVCNRHLCVYMRVPLASYVIPKKDFCVFNCVEIDLFQKNFLSFHIFWRARFPSSPWSIKSINIIIGNMCVCKRAGGKFIAFHHHYRFFFFYNFTDTRLFELFFKTILLKPFNVHKTHNFTQMRTIFVDKYMYERECICVSMDMF